MNELLDSKPASGEGAEVAHNFSYGAFGEGNSRVEFGYAAKWGVQIAGMIFQTRSSIFSRSSFGSPIGLIR